MFEAHDALTCIGEKKFIDDKNRFKYSNQHFLKKNDDLIKLYSDLPEALENNYNFHLRFNYKPKKSKPILPSVAHDKSNSPEEELAKQAKKDYKTELIISYLKRICQNHKNKSKKFMKIG